MKCKKESTAQKAYLRRQLHRRRLVLFCRIFLFVFFLICKCFFLFFHFFLHKQNGKPGYVVNDHLSRPAVASRFQRPT